MLVVVDAATLHPPLLILQLDDGLALRARLAAWNGSAPRLGDFFVAFRAMLS